MLLIEFTLFTFAYSIDLYDFGSIKNDYSCDMQEYDNYA